MQDVDSDWVPVFCALNGKGAEVGMTRGWIEGISAPDIGDRSVRGSGYGVREFIDAKRLALNVLIAVNKAIMAWLGGRRDIDNGIGQGVERGIIDCSRHSSKWEIKSCRTRVVEATGRTMCTQKRASLHMIMCFPSGLVAPPEG